MVLRGSPGGCCQAHVAPPSVVRPNVLLLPPIQAQRDPLLLQTLGGLLHSSEHLLERQGNQAGPGSHDAHLSLIHI